MDDSVSNDAVNSSSSESEEDEVVQEMNQTLEIVPTQQINDEDELNQTLHVLPTQFQESDSDNNDPEDSRDNIDHNSPSNLEENSDPVRFDTANLTYPADGNDDDETSPQSPQISPESPDLLESDNNENIYSPELQEANKNTGSENESSSSESETEGIPESANNSELPISSPPTSPVQASSEKENTERTLKIEPSVTEEKDETSELNHSDNLKDIFDENGEEADDESGDSSGDESEDEFTRPVDEQETEQNEDGSIETKGKLPSSPPLQPPAAVDEDEEYDPEAPEMGTNDDDFDDFQNMKDANEQSTGNNTVIDHQPDNDAENEIQQPQEVINDIFGSSDSGEEFEGFDDADLEREQEPEEAPGEKPRHEERGEDVDDTVSDFDKMMMQKKAEQSRRRRKRLKDDIIINDQDDKILSMVSEMRRASDDDRRLNRENKVAIEKLKLMSSVIYELKKCHLLSAFVENGVLLSIAEWLTPLPDKSLPHLQVRSNMLQILESFPALDSSMLRESGIGKAVMLLYKHPKETRENRIRAGKLVNKWARPIFQLTADFGAMTKADREQRDLEKMPPQKRRKGNNDKKRDEDDEDGPKGPGDAGFVLRARVPQPSFKDYVVRPKSKFERDDDDEDDDEETAMPKPIRARGTNITGKTRLDKYIAKDRERKTIAKNTHAVKVNLNGGKL